MSTPFEPKFETFQGDVEGYLHNAEASQRTRDGSVVYSGYDEALKLIFRQYLDRGVFDPLIAHFRRWNWEGGYNEFLLDLSEALLEGRDWPRLKHLWGGVIAKRRKLYNDVRMIERRRLASVPPETVQQIRDRLLETLRRVNAFSEAIGSPEDSDAYARMIDQVTAGRKV